VDRFSSDILKELFPAEKEVNPPAPAAALRRNNSSQLIDHWSSAVLLERAAYLRKLAKHGDGSASETLKEYPRHCTMLSFRGRSGVPELHENCADLFYVLDGRATMVTGGKIVGAQATGPGEMRGVSIEDGARQELRAGDVAHVPAGVPHQMLVAGDKTVTCLVVKIQEKE
jgi:mannose-6-phosphate isomerase-like protein (cupin superfamily)